MITELFPTDKLGNFSIELVVLLTKFKYKFTSFNTNSGKKLAIVDDSLHPAQIVGFLSPDSEYLITKVVTK
jgi:hypothetical protein